MGSGVSFSTMRKVHCVASDSKRWLEIERVPENTKHEQKKTQTPLHILYLFFFMLCCCDSLWTVNFVLCWTFLPTRYKWSDALLCSCPTLCSLASSETAPMYTLNNSDFLFLSNSWGLNQGCKVSPEDDNTFTVLWHFQQRSGKILNHRH